MSLEWARARMLEREARERGQSEDGKHKGRLAFAMSSPAMRVWVATSLHSVASVTHSSIMYLHMLACSAEGARRAGHPGEDDLRRRSPCRDAPG